MDKRENSLEFFIDKWGRCRIVRKGYQNIGSVRPNSVRGEWEFVPNNGYTLSPSNLQNIADFLIKRNKKKPLSPPKEGVR